MNEVRLMGNLARDVETRVTGTGKEVASFTVAATSTYAGKDGQAVEHTAFINCVAWGKLAESVAQASKGTRVFVSGRLNVRSYEAKDGGKRWVTEVVADFIAISSRTAKTFDDMGTEVARDPQQTEIPF